jgi:hypothetical protein
LSNPYLFLDIRPNERDENILLFRWNHHFDSTDGTTRFSYRYYTDSFAIRANTFTLDYVQPLPHGWTLTPTVRVYSQTAAYFFAPPVYDPVFGPPIPLGYTLNSGAVVSEDYRLSAYGALTLGVKLEKQIAPDYRVNISVENYEQRGDWALFGSGTHGLAPFYARSIQFGLSKAF